MAYKYIISYNMGKQTEEDWKAVSEKTHVCVGVDAARFDVKLFIKRIKG